jgi:hypothetical protein
MNFRTVMFVLSFCACGWQWYTVIAQEAPRPASGAAATDAAPAAENEKPPREATPKELRDGELAISGRYARFERMLSQMADVLGRQDPERADLLRRAIGKGREDQVKENIERVVELLSKGELGTATEKQSEVVTSLEVLLKLLQSEDRRSSVERERERLNSLLKDVRSVLAEQKSARAATQNAEAPSNAAPGQQRALKATEKMLESMKEHDDQEAKDGQKADAEDGDTSERDSSERDSSERDSSEPGSEEKQKSGEEGKSKDGKKGDQGEKSKEELKGKKSEGEKSEAGQPEGSDSKSEKGKAEAKNGDKSQSQGEQSSGKSQSGKKKSGQKSEGKESKQTPGREQLEKAQEQMEEALEKLKEQDRKQALENEDKALEELHEAAARLEEMLKQLREEEKEMLLASLEARFQRMLAAETQIHEGTVSLAATPQKDWLDQYYGRCRVLAQQQTELTVECAQTVNLLREDGTSVSILLAVEDIEADMDSVSGWLQESRVGELTQSVQADIIQSLKQLIETTQKEMQEMKDQQQQQQQQQQSEKKEGLVELMAEIRMLRNLQLQVNRRTKQVNGLLQTAPADDVASIRKQVHDLSVRQRRLTESAKELAKQAQ